MPPTHTIGGIVECGAGYSIPRTLFTADRRARPLPESGRLAVKSGEPTGDYLPRVHVWRQEVVQSLLAACGHERVDGELACAAVFRGVVHAFKLDK